MQSAAYCSSQAHTTFGALFDSFDQTCAIDAPSDSVGTCRGDSGGPLLAARPDSTAVEIGVTSWGPADCSTQHPGFFTRLDGLSGWINQNIAALAPPTVVTSGAGHVGQFSARLNGRLNPNGSPTTNYFGYGTTTGYGQRTPAATTNNGATTIPVSVVITGLRPATTYHYRLVGDSANGTTDGSDQAFTTSPAPAAGRYRGTTGQRWPISLRIASNQRQVVGLSLSYTLRCAKHGKRLSYSFAPTGPGYWPQALNQAGGFGFTDAFEDSDHTQYRVAATLTTSGAASGNLSVSWRTRATECAGPALFTGTHT